MENGASKGTVSSMFGRFAARVARWVGSSWLFFGAVALVVIWGLTGPLFHYSDTWQLVINTATTIVTFLMVFLIQQSQNRDTLAVQIKLAELIIAVKQANNALAIAEELSAHELSELHAEYCRKAEQALKHLESRHGKEAVSAALKRVTAASPN
jgi:low affinity Fe/Cu permease